MVSFGKLIKASGKRRNKNNRPAPNPLVVVMEGDETCFKMLGQDKTRNEQPDNKQDAETFKGFPGNKINII